MARGYNTSNPNEIQIKDFGAFRLFLDRMIRSKRKVYHENQWCDPQELKQRLGL